MPEIFRARPRYEKTGLVKPLRTSPRLRGYDGRWDRLSVAFRKRNPLCRFCEQDGARIVLCDLVDHILPAADRPDLRYEPANLQSLCTHHHSGLKAWLEAEARAIGDLDVLTRWCAEPESRPARRGETHHGGTTQG